MAGTRTKDRDELDAVRARLEAERRRLEQLKEPLLEEVRADDAELSGVIGPATAEDHPADLGTTTFERAKGVSILEQVSAQLRDLEWATDRLEDGTYGRCQVCGQPIGEARLEARPAARYCLEDQRAIERDR
jgi:DnaK suppressor protein